MRKSRKRLEKSLDDATTSDKGLPMQTAQSVRDAQRFEDPDISHLVIEDDTPVDSIFTEKQERLLTAPLYASWSGPVGEDGLSRRSFEVFANVGLFHTPKKQAVVPDIMLSLDVKIRPDQSVKKNRTYFIWEFGKPPDVVIEIVSNRVGGEADSKKRRYRRIGIPYYVIYDPEHHLSNVALRSYELRGELYVAMKKHYFPNVGLGVVEWTGSHENFETTWLRWCTKDGELIPSPTERADDAAKRAERYAAVLRSMGIDPDAA